MPAPFPGDLPTGRHPTALKFPGIRFIEPIRRFIE